MMRRPVWPDEEHTHAIIAWNLACLVERLDRLVELVEAEASDTTDANMKGA